MFGIIYAGENLLDHKIYVGQTVRSLKKRIQEHKFNKNSLIGRALHKYGEENFVWVILEECDSREQMIDRERFWIKKLNSKYPNGYNLTDGGTDTGRITLQSITKNNETTKIIENETTRDYYLPVKIFS